MVGWSLDFALYGNKSFIDYINQRGWIVLNIRLKFGHGMYLKLNLHIVQVKLDMKFYNSFLNPSF